MSHPIIGISAMRYMHQTNEPERCTWLLTYSKSGIVRWKRPKDNRQPLTCKGLFCLEGETTDLQGQVVEGNDQCYTLERGGRDLEDAQTKGSLWLVRAYAVLKKKQLIAKGKWYGEWSMLHPGINGCQKLLAKVKVLVIQLCIPMLAQQLLHPETTAVPPPSIFKLLPRHTVS